MISLGHSLLHLIDVEGARRGLVRVDMIECLKQAIVENMRRRGRIVTVLVDDEEDLAVIDVQEMILTGAGTPIYREVKFVPTVSPELLNECIDEYINKKQKTQSWVLAETRVVAKEGDHYLVEIISARGTVENLVDKIAVLPNRSVSKGDIFRKGQIIWAVVKQNIHAKLTVAYSEPWRDVDAPYIASRNESEFLALMAYQMLNESVQAVIHSSRGILIFPAGEDIKPLLENDAHHKNVLQRLVGLERLCIARRSPHPSIDKRLIHAIKEVAGLKYGRDYKMSAADPNAIPKIYVSPSVAPKLIGEHGHNLYFIKCVVGAQFNVTPTYRATGPSKKTTTLRLPTHDSF